MHTMSQLRAGEGVRWTFWYDTAASTHSVLENTGCDGCWWAEAWILLSNGYWASVWLEMMFRHYWLAGDWSWPCRSRWFSPGCQSPQLSSPLELIWFFLLGVLVFFPTLVRSRVAKYISEQENRMTPCYSKNVVVFVFFFFHCKDLTIFH